MIVRDDKANLILRYWVFSDDILNTVCLGSFLSLEEAKRFLEKILDETGEMEYVTKGRW